MPRFKRSAVHPVVRPTLADRALPQNTPPPPIPSSRQLKANSGNPCSNSNSGRLALASRICTHIPFTFSTKREVNFRQDAGSMASMHCLSFGFMETLNGRDPRWADNRPPPVIGAAVVPNNDVAIAPLVSVAASWLDHVSVNSSIRSSSQPAPDLRSQRSSPGQNKAQCVPSPDEYAGSGA